MTQIRKTNGCSGSKLIAAFYGLSILFSFSACKKQVNDVLPGNEQDVAMNYYSASDVMEAAYGPSRLVVALYVDQFQEQSRPVFSSTDNKFPYFSFGFTSGHDYPQSNNAGMNYARYTAGDHRMMLTDVNNKIVLDTTIKTASRSFNAVYVADAPAAADASANTSCWWLLTTVNQLTGKPVFVLFISARMPELYLAIW